MANKRMFNNKVLDTDAFLDMPLSAQALYFHLNLRADDDGFIANPKRIQGYVGASEDDLKLLVAKRFLIVFDDGVVVVKHWRMHNTIRKDRYTPTAYQDDLAMLGIKENMSYTTNLEYGNQMATKWQPNVSTDIDIDKDLDKEKDIYPVSDVINLLNSTCGTHYKTSTRKTRDLITTRFKEGFSFDDFKTVISKKYQEWKGTDMEQYLRPETLFGNKFEGYLNAKPALKKGANFNQRPFDEDIAKKLLARSMM